jgi:hypothetical protein
VTVTNHHYGILACPPSGRDHASGGVGSFDSG